MKFTGYILWIVSVLSVCQPALAAERSLFQFMAPIEIAKAAGTSVRVPLTPEVIALTAREFTDLRIFDDQGREIPYVIYTQQQRSAQSFTWTILGYQDVNGEQSVMLEAPGNASAIRDLQVSTPNTDFEKIITVYASQDQQNWQKIAEGTIFDFSSKIALRNTAIALPETDARYLKVTFRDRTPADAQGENLRFRYKDLDFSVTGMQPVTLTMTSFISQAAWKTDEAVHIDRVTFSNPTAQTDKDGATVLLLGQVNLPVEQITLSVPKGFFSRRVEVLAAEKDDDQAYLRVADDMIYHIPGIQQEKLTLDAHQSQQPYLRLKIINHDNPPLQVAEVSIAWARRDLYFIPEADRIYTLYCSSREAQTPRYDVSQLISNQFDALMTYPEGKIGIFQNNPIYSATSANALHEAIGKYALMALVLLIALGLGGWAFRLMKNIPTNP